MYRRIAIVSVSILWTSGTKRGKLKTLLFEKLSGITYEGVYFLYSFQLEAENYISLKLYTR